ncbi:MAG TPA: low temperature requirement protein A [Gaiellaceae bacterium]|jgi:low temperature requirement protein LtrA
MLDAVTREELLEAPIEREQRVTALELFFDLVFVFALTQVTSFLYHDPSWLRMLEALAILMVLWLAWSGYMWLGNTAATDEGAIRVVLFTAMGAMLIASLAVPRAFGKDALLFGVAYVFVRALHIVAYKVVARGDSALLGAVFRLAWMELPAAAALVLAGVLPGTGRGICWAVALGLDYVGARLGGLEGWRVNPGHLAERHGLIIIIALGESIVALGVGAGSLGVGTGVVIGALLGIAVAAALWWAYFDVVAGVAERRLRAAGPAEGTRMAVDSYTLLHLPMVAGIVVFAFGVKTTLAHVDAHLHGVPATALCGGVALYLLALSRFRLRHVGSFLIAAAALAALAPVATMLPALLSLGLVALIACGLIAYDVHRYAEARDRIRHGVAR